VCDSRSILRTRGKGSKRGDLSCSGRASLAHPLGSAAARRRFSAIRPTTITPTILFRSPIRPTCSPSYHRLPGGRCHAKVADRFRISGNLSELARCRRRGGD
jgi:hypothetical protein